MTHFSSFQLTLRGNKVVFQRPCVMAILNVTPDSFYEGSRCDSRQAVISRVHQIVDEGADIIDVGAYSTRPGAPEVPVDEEKKRLETAMCVIRDLAPGAITSVDTFRADVARYAVEQLGVDIINDVSGGTLDDQMFSTVARLQVPYVLMHMRGTPATMQHLTDYDNVVDDVLGELCGKMQSLHESGVNDVILDPGFGFSKTLDQNYELMAALERFVEVGAPLLVGISRKSMIYKQLDVTPADALNGTTVLNTVALMAGAHILRVHDVREAVQARALVEKLWQNC